MVVNIFVKKKNIGKDRSRNESYYEAFGRKKSTVYVAISNKLSSKNNSKFVQGASFDELSNVEWEYTYTETLENIDDLYLPLAQFQLADAVFKAVGDKPVILVYLGGRPRIMTSKAERAQAVILL
jgi:beta-glucosidase